MDTYGISWDYFSLWQDGFLDDFTAQQVQTLLNDDDIITLNELPLMPWSASAPIAGDYNRDGVVNAADYVLWRNTMGQTGWGLAADSDFNGRIDAADFAFWRSHFGQTAGSGAGFESLGGPAVPEPGSFVLLILGAILYSVLNRRC